MTDQASFRLQRIDKTPLVLVSGEVDLSNVAAFRSFVAQAAQDESSAVVVSLSLVSYFDSHMLAALAELSQRLQTNRKRLLVCAERNSAAAHILRLNGMDRGIQVFDNEASAIEAAR
jgi:anti-anti-sigma factor